MTKKQLKEIQKNGYWYSVWKNKWSDAELFPQIIELALKGIEK